MKKALHFVMNSKGGVGKSFCACMFAQYLMEKCGDITIFDTDPSNQTLYHHNSLNAFYVDVKSKDKKTIELGGFDAIVDYIYKGKDIILVDTGSSSFIQFYTYLTSEGIQTLFAEQEWELYVHIPIVGGGPYNDCITNIRQLSEGLTNAKLVIWINNFPGYVFDPNMQIDNLEEINSLSDKIIGIVNLPHFEPSTTGKVLKAMMSEHKCFCDFNKEDALLSGRPLSILEAMRVKKIKQDIFQSISALDSEIF